MNINYHYYTIKTLALAAGFSEQDAQRIAHFSQYVDDCVLPRVALTDVEPPPFFAEHGLSKTDKKHKHWKVAICSTGIGIVHSISPAYQVHAITPFHFIPPKPLPEILKSSRTAYRCVQASPEKEKSNESLLINSLMDNVIKNQTAYHDPSTKEDYLITLGLMLHTYADTYAHCYFSGLWGRENKSHVVRIFDKEHKKEIGISNFLKLVPPIGHANVGYVPDICYYDIEINMKYDDLSIKRDNASSFAICSENILKLLCKITKKEPIIEFVELQKKIAEAQMVEKEEPKYLTSNWEKVFSNIFPDLKNPTYKYNKHQYFHLKYIPIIKGMANENSMEADVLYDNPVDPYSMLDPSDSLYTYSEDYIDEGYNDETTNMAESVPTNQMQNLSCTVPKPIKGINKDFYTYMQVAYERIYAVTADYEQLKVSFDTYCANLTEEK